MSNEPQVVTLTMSDRPRAVNREEDVGAFCAVLDRILLQRPGLTPVLEWVGGPGIGKSTLVRELLIPECEKRAVPWMLMDFKSSPVSDFVADPTRLLEAILLQLGQTARGEVVTDRFREALTEFRRGERPPEIIRAYSAMSPDDRLYNRPPWLDGLRDVVREFIAAFGRLGQAENGRPRPVVLFFDETEHSDFELADWIEEWIVSPLVQLKQVVVVWTARRPWRWKRPEIRRRLESRALEVFSEESVQAQFRSSGSRSDLVSALFAKVYAVTGGHPFANAVVIDQVNSWEAEGQRVTAETFSERERVLLAMIFEKFIRDYAFEKLDREARIACELMGLVRIFDTTMLRRVLQEHGGQPFRDWRQEDYGDLLLRLKKTQLLVWTKGYGLDPALRYLIHEYYAACQPETYVAVNRTALEVYREWLTRPVDNRALFVIEALYHQACLRRAGEAVSLEETLEKQLHEYRARIKDGTALRQALEQLEGELEQDAELRRLTDGYSSSRLVDQVQSLSML